MPHLWPPLLLRGLPSGGLLQLLRLLTVTSDTMLIFGVPVGQGYGLTETCAGAAFTEWDDTRVGRVGSPLPSCYVKLVSWEDGGYRISDSLMPRGEVVVGHSITKGYFSNEAKTNEYFSNEAKTNEVYKVDDRGIHWFYTGDIGQFHPDGCLEIMDRK